MKYIVDVAGERIEVTLDSEGVHIDGEDVRSHIADVAGTPIQLVTVGTEVHRVAVVRGAERGRYTLWLDGYRFDVDALDERTRTIRDLTAATAGPKGPAPLIAPMPGLIMRINVAEGEAVQAGQGLVLMEAMKMENELRTSSAGTVKSILVKPGQAVEKGTTLIELA